MMTVAGRRRILVWLALPAVVALAVVTGYLALGRAGSASTSAGQAGHVVPDRQTMAPGMTMPDGQRMPGGQSTPDGHSMAPGMTMPDGQTMAPGQDMPGTEGKPTLPRALVLGTFGALIGGALVTAAVLRRRAPARRRRPAPRS